MEIMITLTPVKAYLDKKSRPKLPHLLVNSRSLPHLEDTSVLKVIPESPMEQKPGVELKMKNRRLVLMNEGKSYSLSQYIERQFEGKTRGALLEPVTSPHITARKREFLSTSRPAM